jgi:hypothetical protein
MRIEDKENSTFKWNLSKEDASEIAEKIHSVMISSQPCHHYLDVPSDDVEVVVSKGEYTDSFIP